MEGSTAQSLANVLREGTPAIWVQDALAGTMVVDLRRLSEEEVGIVAERIRQAVTEKTQPQEDVPYHDLYRSTGRLQRWPDRPV